MSPPLTRTSLFEALQLDRDDHRYELAWQRLDRDYREFLIGLAKRRGCQQQDAEDIAQDTLAVLQKRMPQLQRSEHPGGFRGYLRTIVNSRLGDAYRRQSGKPTAVGGTDAWMVSQQVADPFGEDANAESNIAVSEDHFERSIVEHVSEKIRRSCKPATWAAFELTRLEDLPLEVAAERLDMKPQTVRRYAQRILTRIQTEADAMLDGEIPPPFEDDTLSDGSSDNGSGNNEVGDDKAGDLNTSDDKI